MTRKLNKVQRRQVKAIVSRKEESKHFDTQTAAFQVDRGGNFALLSAMGQGTGIAQRVGDQVRCQFMELNFDLYYTNAAGLGTAGHAARLIVFRWNIDTSITTPGLGSILEYTGNINTMNSPYTWNAQKQKDFTVLLDRVYGLFQGRSEVRRLRIPLRGSRIDFDPAATTAEGHLYALWLGDDVTGAHTPDLSVQYQTRLVYKDA